MRVLDSSIAPVVVLCLLNRLAQGAAINGPGAAGYD